MSFKISFISYVSLGMGLVIGLLGQASRMCFIGGWRDFILIRDKYLLKGFFSFLITAMVLFFLFNNAGYYLGKYPWYARPPAMLNIYTDVNPDDPLEWYMSGHEEWATVKDLHHCELMMMPAVVKDPSMQPHVNIFGLMLSKEMFSYLVAAFFIEFLSVLANGCPVRQHVMAGSGNASAILYLVGFYAAIIVYDKYLVQYINAWANHF